MAVLLSPSSALNFNRPFHDPVKRTLVVSNRNKDPIAFKVKTTAPKAYSVRPNAGRIEPDGSVEIQVVLGAMKEDPPLGAKCKDKFLVQSVAITPEMTDAADFWSAAEAPVIQQRLKVNFLPQEGQKLEEADETQHDSTYLSVNDSHRYDTVRQFPTTNGASHLHPSALPPPPISSFNSEHVENTLDRGASPQPDFHAAQEAPDMPTVGISEVLQPTIPHPPAEPSSMTNINTPLPQTPSVPQSTHVTLQAKYAEAQQEIARLRSLLASVPEPSVAGTNNEGLRRRNVPGSSVGADDSTVIVEEEEERKKHVDVGQMQQDGVPPQIVAIIAMVVFTLTYLFF